MRAKRIIFCDNSLFGLLNFRIDVIKHLKKQGYQIYLIAPNDGDFGELQKIDGIAIIELKTNRSSTNIFSQALYFAKIFFYYAKIRPICVFHYTIKPNIYGTIACRILKIKSIVVITGLGFIFHNEGMLNKLYRRLYKFAVKRAFRVITINKIITNLILTKGFATRDKVIFSEFGEGINLDYFK